MTTVAGILQGFSVTKNTKEIAASGGNFLPTNIQIFYRRKIPSQPVFCLKIDEKGLFTVAMDHGKSGLTALLKVGQTENLQNFGLT